MSEAKLYTDSQIDEERADAYKDGRHDGIKASTRAAVIAELEGLITSTNHNDANKMLVDRIAQLKAEQGNEQTVEGGGNG